MFLPKNEWTNSTLLLKPDQNKKGQKNFQLHRFLNTFLQLAAEKNSAAGKFFGPSYFVSALWNLRWTCFIRFLKEI